MENIKTSPIEKQADNLRSEPIQAGVEEAQKELHSSIESWTPETDQKDVASDNKVSETISENAIIDAISTVYDPEIPVNVYELGLVYAVDLHDDGRVNVEMTLTAPNCPSAQELPIMIQQAIEKVPGVTQVQVEVVWDPPWDVSRMSDEARLTLNMF